MHPGPPSPNERPTDSSPSSHLLWEVYKHLSAIVFHLTIDGIILHCNPAATKITGYHECELVGHNIWANSFQEDSFSQVPKFISATHPGTVVGQDVPMTIRTHDGKTRIIGWQRFTHEIQGPGGEVIKSIICIGNDLTDRLTDADRATQPHTAELGIGNGGSVDGEVVTPIAISPPQPGGTAAAIEKVQKFITEMDGRLTDIEQAFTTGELGLITQIATAIKDPAYAGKKLELCSQAEHLYVAAAHGSLTQVAASVQDVTGLCKGRKKKP